MDHERKLLQQAHSFDLDALAAIFDEYYEPLYRYIYYHIPHIQTAEDLTAKVFQRLLENLHAGRGPEQRLKAWLFRVAYNLIVDDSRRQQHRNHALLIEDMPAPITNIDADIVKARTVERAYSALTQLTTKQRDIIILRYLMEMTPTEIAEIRGITVGAVKALQHRGLNTLRQELKSEQETVDNE